MRDYKELLHNKNFVSLWISQILSQFSVNLLNFIIVTNLYKFTGSAIAVSLVWIFYAIPILLVGPIASASVDLLNKKNILIYTNLVQSAIILVYGLGSGGSIFLVYGLVMAYSLLNQFYVPAELASVPYLVNKKNLAQANSLYFITQQSAVIFGFGIASILLGLLGYKISVFISSLMLFIAFISVNFINTEKLGRKKTDLEKSFGAFFLHILEGYKHIKKDKYILAPLGLIVGLQVVLAIAFTNLPILADELFNTPVEYAGLLIVTPGGIGAAIAAYTIPKLLQKYRKLHVIKHAMQLMIFSLLILNFANGIFSGVKYLAISALGYSYISIFIPSQTFLQEQTPDKLRGRVFGNLWLLTTLFTILPLILTASIVEIFGVHLLVYLIGAGIFAVYLLLNKFGEKWMYRSY